MKDFKNENEYGNMKTEDEAYDGVLLKTGDEGYRYFSSSGGSGNIVSVDYSDNDSGYSPSPSTSNDNSNSSSNQLGEVIIDRAEVSKGISGYTLTMHAKCENAWNMCLYLDCVDTSAQLFSGGTSAAEISGTRSALTAGKTYRITAVAIPYNGTSKTAYREVPIYEELGDVTLHADILGVDITNSTNNRYSVSVSANSINAERMVIEFSGDSSVNYPVESSVFGVQTTLGEGTHIITATSYGKTVNGEDISKDTSLTLELNDDSIPTEMTVEVLGNVTETSRAVKHTSTNEISEPTTIYLECLKSNSDGEDEVIYSRASSIHELSYTETLEDGTYTFIATTEVQSTGKKTFKKQTITYPTPANPSPAPDPNEIIFPELVNGEASVDVTLVVGKPIEIKIPSIIKANKLVVASVDHGACFLKLKSNETSAVVSAEGTSYGPDSDKFVVSMQYFMTAVAADDYKLIIEPYLYEGGNYTVRIRVADMVNFSKCDTRGYESNELNFCLSNHPEQLPSGGYTPQFVEENKGNYLGEYGHYIQRSVIEGRANIFWEHQNMFGRPMLFGVLLYNDNDYSVNVRLKKRGYSSFKDGDYSALCNTTMSDVWKTWFNGLIIPDLSTIGQEGLEETVNIGANAACWVCLHEAKHYIVGDTIRNTFTGVVEVEIEESKALKCDTYIMEFGGEDGLLYSNIVKQNASNPLLTYCGNTSYAGGGLSGSGNGAILYTSINADDIITDGLKFVLGGDHVTNFSEINNGSVDISMSEFANARNSCNYGTIFCVDIQCSDAVVTDVVTARIRCNMATNPSAMCDIVNNSDGGARGYMNVAAKHEIYDKNGKFLNQTVKGLPIYIDKDGTSNELEISDNIDLNYKNRFYFVLGGISQTPFEFIIRKKESN